MSRYSESCKNSQIGLPVMRPLVLDYPDDERTHNMNIVFRSTPVVSGYRSGRKR